MKITLSKAQWQFIGKKAGWENNVKNYDMICVWDWNEHDGAYASDCNAIFSKKFADTILEGETCPKCNKTVVKSGNEEPCDGPLDDCERPHKANVRGRGEGQ